jgi:hypothetical protein
MAATIDRLLSAGLRKGAVAYNLSGFTGSGMAAERGEERFYLNRP